MKIEKIATANYVIASCRKVIVLPAFVKKHRRRYLQSLRRFEAIKRGNPVTSLSALKKKWLKNPKVKKMYKEYALEFKVAQKLIAERLKAKSP